MKCQEYEQTVPKLTKELDELKDRLKTIPKTESRLQALVQDGYVRPDLTNKRLMDAIRVTSRNVFIVPFRIFRAQYGNFRDDHVIFRQLTRSPGKNSLPLTQYSTTPAAPKRPNLCEL